MTQAQKPNKSQRSALLLAGWIYAERIHEAIGRLLRNRAFKRVTYWNRQRQLRKALDVAEKKYRAATERIMQTTKPKSIWKWP
jgi:hypothetical protein